MIRRNLKDYALNERGTLNKMEINDTQRTNLKLIHFQSGGDILSKIKNVLLVFVLLFVISGCEKITDTVLLPPDTSETEPLTVMTYNVYLGASAVNLLSVESLLQVPEEVANLFTPAWLHR